MRIVKPQHRSTPTTGIHAALVVPFRPGYELDEEGYRRQLDFVMRQSGIRGLLVNGHAGENSTTTDDEKDTIVTLTRRFVGPNFFITSGVYSESTAQAVRQAQRLESAGADALLVFQPNSWAIGAEPISILTHHRMIHDAVGAPIMLYQAPVTSGRLAYDLPVLTELIKLQRVAAIKDGSWEIVATESVRDHVKSTRPDIVVYGSGDEHLLVNYLIGTEGSQVSLAAVTPGLICRLWDAAEAGDWTHAKSIHRLIQPLAQLIYRSAPASRAVARLKACLKILGVIESDVVRPPSASLPNEEYKLLEDALRTALTDSEEVAWINPHRPSQPAHLR